MQPKLIRQNLSVYLALANAVEARNPYTYLHSSNVAQLSVLFGRYLGLDPNLLESLKIGGLLHDVGKIGVPDAILLKPGPLNPQELEVMQGHPVIGHQIVGPLQLMPAAQAIILYHHERWDGGGYPYGFAGEDIPLAARLVALADAIDAMLSARPYKPAMSPNSVIAEIHAQCGAQFDPAIAKIVEKYFFRIVKLYNKS